MASNSAFRLRPVLALSAAALIGTASLGLAETAFDAPADFTGSVMFSGPERTPVYKGAEVDVMGRGFAPGQAITLRRGDTLISSEGLTADGEGGFSFSFQLDDEAVVGTHPIVVQTDAPDSAGIAEMQVSPNVPLSGEDQFQITSAKVTPGLYQAAYSEQNGALFVVSAVGRPPVDESRLVRLDPETLEIVAEATPGEAPGRGERAGGVFAVYGVDVDDAHGNLWVTNTRQNTVAVYAQDDLALVKQFPEGLVPHSRDVVIDEARGRAYVSSPRSSEIAVLDTETLEQLDGIAVQSGVRGGQFGAMSLALDEENGKLYTVSLSTPEAARIDLESGEVTLFSLPGAKRASGVDVDPATGRIFVASQGSDNVIALDGGTGAVLFDTPVGAGTLNVDFNAATGQLFVANRGSDTLTVLDAASGEIVANLDGGSFPNHITVTADGTVFAVNKARGQDDPEGDRITRIVPAE